MFSKALAFAVGVFSCFVAISGMPLNSKVSSRQFTIPVETPTPVPVVDDESAATPATEPVPVVATETPAMGTAMSGETTPAATMEPTEEGVVEMTESTDAATTEATTTDVAGIYYNIGGAAFGAYAADPLDYLVGETSQFEIADAVIVGAEPDNVDVYKSHRYGLLGSTWGYDLPVTTPGVYDCTLHYCEIYSEFFTEEPNRTFMVSIVGDGAPVVHQAEFDVMVELAGAEFTAYNREFPGISAATVIAIRETPTIGDAFLSGIACKYVSPLPSA